MSTLKPIPTGRVSIDRLLFDTLIGKNRSLFTESIMVVFQSLQGFGFLAYSTVLPRFYPLGLFF